MACHACGALHVLGKPRYCRRCGNTVRSRFRNSLQRTWAFLLVGMIVYVPANVYPIMATYSFSGDTTDTIFSGVLSLIDTGNVGIAIIVFTASIIIPIAKFIAIAFLALSIQLRVNLTEHTRHRLHAITEFIGRWSMIDVFVVAVLTASIQLGSIRSVEPGIGINAFAASVVFTMLAANALDPRLIWDRPMPSETRVDAN
ncbi:MAG: paraquat-inducible membrane protein A [Gammaproteobacteria bacterium]|nr:MAG: paraquat-inducible membrane protein A [Gammaproteobacteria bacterium]